MSGQRYAPEFKDEAIRAVLENGDSVQEVSQRLGASAHSIYKWINSVKPEKEETEEGDLAAARKEIAELKARLKKVEEERDVMKKAARYFATMPD